MKAPLVSKGLWKYCSKKTNIGGSDCAAFVVTPALWEQGKGQEKKDSGAKDCKTYESTTPRSNWHRIMHRRPTGISYPDILVGLNASWDLNGEVDLRASPAAWLNVFWYTPRLPHLRHATLGGCGDVDGGRR